ncbi:flavin reductase family protein [Streptosporangium lutulentum]
MSEFIEAMAQVPTAVTVITVKDERDDVGTTVATFTSVSLDPRLVMVSMENTRYLNELLLRHDRWAASVLSTGQKTIASRFATAGRPGARLLLAGTPHHRGELSGALVVDGGVTALEAETVQVVPAGDHTLLSPASSRSTTWTRHFSRSCASAAATGLPPDRRHDPAGTTPPARSRRAVTLSAFAVVSHSDRHGPPTREEPGPLALPGV